MNKPPSGLHVLVIPAWMPDVKDRAAGMFIIDQCIALQENTRHTLGLIFRTSAVVPPEVLEMLDAHSIHFVIDRRPYIPKFHSIFISLWARDYLNVFQKYVSKYGAPDIIHAHSYIAGFAAAYISALTGIPFILTEHATAFLSGNIKAYQRRTLIQVFNQASWIIAVGRRLRDAMKTYTRREIAVVPNCYNDTIFTPGTGGKEEVFTLIAVGSLIRRKNFDVLLKAFSLLKEMPATLIIVGDGPEKRSLKLLATQLRLNGSVQWFGYLNPSVLAVQMQRSHVLISASNIETFGITVVEAMGCGLPVVVTRCGGPEDYVGEEEGIVLTLPVNPENIATAIREIHKRYDTYDKTLIAEKARTRFGRLPVCSMISKVYEEVVESR